MRKITTLAAVAALLLFVSSAFAVPTGKNLEWESSAGKIIFDGKAHADKGLKCNDCHTKIFAMKKGSAKMTMEQLNAGKFCGECHNGTKAFKSDDAATCAKCHHK